MIGDYARTGALILCIVLAVFAAAGLIGDAYADDLRILKTRLFKGFREWLRRKRIARNQRQQVLRRMSGK
jgi:hypothetical protein